MHGSAEAWTSRLAHGADQDVTSRLAMASPVTTRAIDVDSLLQLMGWYYPLDVEAESPEYNKTEQARRLQALLGGMARDMGLIETLAAGLKPVPD